MKVKGLLLSMALLLGAGSAWADDNVSVVRPLTIKAGQTQKVAVALENAKAYTAFQMDIKLPTGLTLSNPKSLRTSDATFHNITAGEVEGVTRVVALSYKQENDGSVLAGNGNLNFIDDNSPIILFFDITAADDYVDDGNIEVKNVKFVSADGTTQAMADASSASGLILGDANGDKNVDTKDAIKLVEQYLGKNPSNFDKKAADITLDGTFDTKDAIQIITVYLGK
jgi:hypothetical protein